MSKRILLKTVLALSISSYPATSTFSQVQPSNPPAQQPTQVTTPSNLSIQVNPGTTPSVQPHPPAQVQLSNPPIQQNQGTTLSPPPPPAIQLNPGTTPVNPTVQQRGKVTIPASAAIVVTFCSGFEFDTKQEASFPATVFLARPIIDSDGNIAAPVNSLVRAQLKPVDEGAEIKAEALVVGGRVVPIETTALSVPLVAKVRQESTSYYGYGQNNQGIVLGLANSLQKWLGNQGLFDQDTNNILDFGLSIASGISTGINNRKPKVTKTMEFPGKFLFILTLSSPIVLPPMPIQITPSAGGQVAGSVCSENTGFTPGSSYSPVK
jgi:hypothetical protein